MGKSEGEEKNITPHQDSGGWPKVAYEKQRFHKGDLSVRENSTRITSEINNVENTVRGKEGDLNGLWRRTSYRRKDPNVIKTWGLKNSRFSNQGQVLPLTAKRQKKKGKQGEEKEKGGGKDRTRPLATMGHPVFYSHLVS